MKIRALIVDDEPIARKGIRRELAAAADIEVIGECANGRDAVRYVREQSPDLLFLDLQMPELDGFGVIEELGKLGVERLPTLIFVTAFDEFALKAFEVCAFDYLLKPFTSERFQKTLRRACEQIRERHAAGSPASPVTAEQMSERLLALLQTARPSSLPPEYLERLVVKTNGRIFFLKVEEVDWIEAADNYVRLHIGGESHLVAGTMSRLERRLDPQRFLRVHRSTIVNLTRIRELQPLFHGEYAIVLDSGKELTSSRSYRDRLQRLLDNRF